MEAMNTQESESSTMHEHLQSYLAKIEAESSHRAAVQAKYFLKDIPDNLTAQALDEYRTQVRASGLAATSVNRKLSAVRSYLLWLQRTERIDLGRSAIKDNLGHYRTERKKIGLPEPKSVHRLVELALDRPGKYGVAYCRFIALGLFAGLRPGEIEALTGDDLPRGKQYIHVKRTKTGVERHAYYSQSAVLSRCLPDMRGMDNIVQSGARDWFAAAAVEAGMGKQSRNVLRKLHCSYMACSGQYSEYWLMQHLGHTTATSIKHYRDPEVLEWIKPGTTIEVWMGLGDLTDALVERIGAGD